MRRHAAATLLVLFALAGQVGAEAPPSDPWQVLELPSGLAERVDREIGAVTASPESRFEQLVDFMHQSGGVDFRYRATPTHDLASTYDGGEGNCLSFTLLFISLARHLGLDARPREVRIRPSWESDNDLLKLITHVNISVRMPGREAIVDFEPDFVNAMRLGSPFRGRTVSDERALAHFHNNRAVELLAEGKVSLARAWIEQALRLDDEFVPALNTLGVVQRRQGDRDQARASFRQALLLDPDNELAATNLLALNRPSEQRQALWLAGLPETGGKTVIDRGSSKFDRTNKSGKPGFGIPD